MEQPSMKTVHERLARLELAVVGPSKERRTTKLRQTDSGPTGGVRTLIAQGFFESKRNLAESRAELAKHEYHYRAQAVDMPLKRLSRRDGP